MINLSELIAPSFYEVHRLIKEHKYTHWVLSQVGVVVQNHRLLVLK